MKYIFTFEIFGKKMTAEIEAPNADAAKEFMLRKIQDKVKIISVEPDYPKFMDKKAADFVEEMFGKFGMNVKR